MSLMIRPDEPIDARKRRILVLRRSRLGQQYEELKPSKTEDRKVKILMVGYSGSGKTLLLASLYHSFAVGTPVGIRFEADDDSNRRLVKIADNIRDPLGQLPPGNIGMDQWNFNVRVESRTSAVDMFTLELMDYAGGFFDRMLEIPDDEYANKFGKDPIKEFPSGLQKQLRAANVLVGVIDGERLVKVMQKGPPEPRLVGVIERLLNILSRTDHPNVHLVITKWDKLRTPDGTVYTTAEVRDRLDEISQTFWSFRESPRRADGMRIIPVSVFGLNGVRGEAGWRWRPWNVQIPFFAALPDILAGDIPRLRRTSRTSWVTIDILRTAVLVILKASAIFELGIPIGIFIVKIPSDLALRLAIAFMRIGPARRKLPDPLTQDSALRYVVNRSFAALRRFEAQTRGSRIRKLGSRD